MPASISMRPVNPLRPSCRRGLFAGLWQVTHQYPHCWRCRIGYFRATEQWFASVKDFRDETLAAIDRVKWYPAWGRDRIHNMVKERHDWCISRQRVWGVPIPIFYCADCGKELITDETIAAVRDLFRREGSNAWFEKQRWKSCRRGRPVQNVAARSLLKRRIQWMSGLIPVPATWRFWTIIPTWNGPVICTWKE